MPSPASNGNAAGANAKRPSKLRKAAKRLKALFQRKKDVQQTKTAQVISSKDKTTQTSAGDAVANESVAQDQPSTESKPNGSPPNRKSPRPAKTLISETKTKGFIELTVRMEAKQKRKSYYVNAAECPISVIKAMFADEFDLDGGAQAVTLRFDGHRLRDESTPAQCDMESGDLLDAFHDED